MKSYNELKIEGLNHLKELNSGKHAEFTGWMNISETTDDEIEYINKIAKEVQGYSEVLVVIGIGGSYLGARAVIEALTNKYDKSMEVIYLGNSTSALDMKEALDYLETKEFTVNVISKSGTTLEPALAFSFIKKLLFDKYPREKALKRIIVTTDKDSGELRKFANDNGVVSFVIPDDVGGRFSVLTPVGLLPMAVAGVDIGRLVGGATTASNLNDVLNTDNDAIEYATMRNIFHREGLDIEILVSYEPRLKYFSEWWKQLFGESEGKDGKGIYPSSATFTTDLHSIGQLIQDGKRNLFETHLSFSDVEHDLVIVPSEEDSAALGYLAGKTVNHVNKQAKDGSIEAHESGGVPIFEINMGELSEDSLGQLIYFFELACAISAMMSGVNPFDQPGVETYKKNIKRLLS